MTKFEKKIFWNSESGGAGGEDGEEDYLSKLAKSILKKEKPANSPPPAGHSSQVNQIPPGMRRPQQRSSETVRKPESVASTPPQQQQQPEQRPDVKTMAPAQNEGARGWSRKVDIRDEEGRFLPGTIVVFEDGTLGIQKEYQATKDYDIVYQLKDNGRAVPQGIPLHNYDVDAIGRLSQMCLDSLIKSSEWDRDMIIFHLLKFKDIAYVPHHGAERGSSDAVRTRQSTIAPRLSQADLQDPETTPPSSQSPPPAPSSSEMNELPADPNKPQRGRRMKIDFGPGRSWEAVYWGRDELGHVVAHNTHDKWSLMHLDLDRFKETCEWGDLVDKETLQKMAKDFEGK